MNLAFLALAVLVQDPDRGGFITQLGNDTIAVERFAWKAGELEGERVIRFPETSTIRYRAKLAKDGSVATFEAKRFEGENLEKDPSWSSRIEFGPKLIVMDFDSKVRGKRTVQFEAGPATVPMLLHCYALYEQMIRQTRRTPDRQVPIEMIYPGQDFLAGTWIRPQGPDSVAISYFHDVPGYARIDAAGRLLGFSALETVLKVVVTRVPDLDVRALGRDFAARDAAGKSVGPLSPRDTVRATVGGAALMIDYSRPSKRGREIFGALVPWNQVWRTGADAATQFSTSRDLLVGNITLRAGSYTLWTKPGPNGAVLIVNSQTGQWGTDYDPRRDVVSIPLTVKPLDQPVERFTIAIEPAGAGAELRFSWDTVEWDVAMQAK